MFCDFITMEQQTAHWLSLVKRYQIFRQVGAVTCLRCGGL